MTNTAPASPLLRPITIRIPASWEVARETLAHKLAALIEAGEPKTAIVDTVWHHGSDDIEYPFATPPVISFGFDGLEKTLEEVGHYSLLRLVFRESLRIMGKGQRESEALKSQFKELIKGNLSQIEFDQLYLALTNKKNTLPFGEANRLAWGAIRKDILAAGIQIQDDKVLWYIMGVVDKYRSKAK